MLVGIEVVVNAGYNLLANTNLLHRFYGIILHQSSLQITYTSSFIVIAIICVLIVLFYRLWLKVHCTNCTDYLSHQNKNAYEKPQLVINHNFSLYAVKLVDVCCRPIVLVV